MSDKKYAKKVIRINTKFKGDFGQFNEMVQPLIDYANKHEIAIRIGYNEEDDLICECVANGLTSAYCKGACSEIQEMLKQIFHCKLDVVLYAY